MITVKLLLVGMIAVAYEDDKTVILVREFPRAANCHDGKCTNPHFPILEWDASSCTDPDHSDSDNACDLKRDITVENCEGCVDPDGDPCPTTTLEARKDLLFLDGYDLEILDLEPSSVEQLDRLDAVRLDSVRRTKPWPLQAGKIADVWLDGPQYPPGFAARLELPPGAIRMAHLVDNKAGGSPPYKVAQLKSGCHKGPTPDILLAEFSVSSNELSIRASRPEVTKTITLKPNNNREIILVLSNQPTETKPPVSPEIEESHHFEYYYHFSQKPPRPSKAAYPKVIKWLEPEKQNHIVPASEIQRSGHCLLEKLAHKNQGDENGNCLADLFPGERAERLRNILASRYIGSRPNCPSGGF